MIDHIRARPWSVHTFSALLLGIGLHTLTGGLAHLDEWLLTFENMVPQFPWNRDWVIVAHSARFSIVCIPVAAVWIWHRAFARTLVTLFTVLACAGLIRMFGEGTAPVDGEAAVKTAGIALACALLFTPSANRWLHGGRETSDAGVFE